MAFFTRTILLICLLYNVPVFAQQANFTASPTSGCAPLLVSCTSTSGGSPTSYNWDFGNGAPSVNQPNASTTYLNAGTYTITLTVNYGGTTSTKQTTITVFPKPSVNFTAVPVTGCEPLSVQFTDQTSLNSPGGATYYWDYGDGSPIGTSPNVSHIYSAGVYPVSLTVTNGAGCTDQMLKPNYINSTPKPVADFGVSNQNICLNSPTTVFTSNSAGAQPFSNCSWNFGDGTSGTGLSVAHTYTLAGTYSVRMIITDANGCIDTILKQNYITVDSMYASFTAPASVCDDEVVQFVATSPAFLYVWDLGDGTPATGPNVNHTYNGPGTYTATLTAYNMGSCSAVASQIIIVKPKPNIDFNYGPLDACPAQASVHFTNLTTGASSYTWRFGDLTPPSTQTNPTHVYNNSTFYSVTLVATGTNGCVDSLTKYDYVKIYPLDASIYTLDTGGCIPFRDSFSASVYYEHPSTGVPTPYPWPITSWSWNFGDGSATSTAPNPVHVYTDSGNFTVTLTITTANGCTKTTNTLIRTGTHSTPGFTAVPTTVCVDEQVHFTNSSINATDYIWDFGDGILSDDEDPIHPYSDPGWYDVTLISINNGCKDTLKIDSMIHVNFPKAQIAYTYNCDTQKRINFFSADINATSRLWLLGDGTTSTAVNISHTYAGFGVYTVKHIAYNSTTGCTDTATQIVTVDQPNFNFTALDTAICRGDTAYFTGTQSGPITALDYRWIFGSQVVGTLNVPSVARQYPTSGVYTVKMVVLDSRNCRDTITRTDYIRVAWPLVNFTASPTVACFPGTTVQITDNTTNTAGVFTTNRTWDFGDGTGATGTPANTSHFYGVPGSYYMKLVVTDNVGCKDSLLKPAYIQVKKPVAQFSNNKTTVCIGTPLTFLNLSTGVPLTSSWDFGDGGTANVTHPAHTYTAAGVYTVKLVVTTNQGGCKDSITKVALITVVDNPVASFTISDTLVCPGVPPVIFTSTSTGATNYKWNFGNGNISLLPNPQIIYTQAGNFPVTLVVTNANGCKDTATAVVHVLGYSGAFTYTPLQDCAPFQVSFTAQVPNISSYIWDFNDGNTLQTTVPTATHTYTTPGAFIPRLILTSSVLGCQATSIGLDTIKVDGVYAGFTTVPNPVCEKGTVIFQDTSHGAFSPVSSWLWVFHDGQTSTTQNPSHTYTGPGTYDVTLITQTSIGCKDTLERKVIVYPPADISAGADTIICVGDIATLQPSGGVSYEWTGTNLSCNNCTSPEAAPTAPSSYIVLGTDANGCKATDTMNIDLQTKTTSDVGPGGEICEEASMQLIATGAQQYSWTPPIGLNDAGIPNPLASPTTTTTYMVIATEGSCAPDTGYVEVIVHPKPDVNAGPDQTIVAGNTAYIETTQQHAISYAWTPEDWLSCADCPNPAATPKRTTEYTVTVATDFGCLDSDKVIIHVICDQSQVYMPNTFTPNNDGQNDHFYPRGKGLQTIKSFRIYNRWGQLLYEKQNMNTNEYASGWDGTFNGKALNPDVFVYMVDAICDTGEPVSWQGDISLIR